MAEEGRHRSHSCSPTGSTGTPIMATPLRKVCNRILGFATSCRKNTAPYGRRIFHREVEQDEFQYGNTHCLSSYYSVFVVRLAIMAMLAILIGLLTILTWHFTRSYTKKSLDTLASGLRYELLQRPILRMWNILNSTAEITAAQVKLSEYVIGRYSKTTIQAEQVELYEVMRHVTWALFASRKALNSITINYRNGFVQAFHRDHRSNNTFYIYSDLRNYSINAKGPSDTNMFSSHQAWNDQSIQSNSSAIWYREPLDPTSGEKIGKASPIPPVDLINIAGLSQVPDGVASWHVAVSKYTDSPLLSAALPVWDAYNKSIVAVVGVTTALYSVGQLMRELVEVHSGYIYLTSQEGFLLATSTNAPLLTNSTRPNLIMAVDTEEPTIRMGARWLERVYGNKFPPGHVVHVENAKLGKQQCYIDSFFLNLKRLPIVGVIIIPRRYIMGKVDERAFKTLVILISASICILVIGCVFILILTNGVSKEMKLRAELISHLDARRRAEASNNYKSQFLANMSHELRTPMAAVIGLLDILICDDCLTNEQYANVTQIRKCSTALLRLLNNILDLSKVESGKLVLEDAEFDLGRELEGLIDMFSVQCINHNVEAVLDLSDEMPKLVRGDSARVVQIFANLISNSIKFTTTGHIILRGWCENLNNTYNDTQFHLDQKKMRCAIKPKLRQQGKNHLKKACKKENKMILWFEIDDTGCGIDPSKWESVFESFEQADPSTTRLHGGTGLGLCIVRTLVNKMGGEIKVVKKNGPGTLMRLYLLLKTPADGADLHCQVDFSSHNAVVLVALYGSMGRVIMSQWLREIGLTTVGVSEWNELTRVLRKLFHARRRENGFDVQCSLNEPLKSEVVNIEDMKDLFIIVVDVGLLDLSTDIWKEQINFLDNFSGKAKFAWMLNHDTSNAIKMELRKKGHLLMVNKPLYKAKMIHILETVIKEKDLEYQKTSLNATRAMAKDGDLHECLEIDSTHFDTTSSEESDTTEMGGSNSPSTFHLRDVRKEREEIACQSQCQTFKCLIELTDVDAEARQDPGQNMPNLQGTQYGNEMLVYNKQVPFPTATRNESSKHDERNSETSSHKEQGNSYSNKAGNQQKALDGLRILLAEDTPVLQRVATIMLKKMGAKVITVGDGLQAVEALNCSLSEKDCRRESPGNDGHAGLQTEIQESQSYDLILMDCQMPKMDGYEATKAIRKSETGTDLHIPIVALTAHAMSSDEAKCLEVGMDAYLTKPIDYKLMVSTILSLTRRKA